MKNFIKKYTLHLYTSCMILLTTPLSLYGADEINTGWLKATTGSSGQLLGAEVIQVEQADEFIIIDVDIPADNLQDYETIVVIGKRSNQAIPLNKQPEILNDDNGKAYGLRFQIKRMPNFEFRLRLYDDNQDSAQ